MSDATGLDSSDYVHAMHNKTSNNKPTNLDQEMDVGLKKNVEEPTPPSENHEDATPEEQEGGNINDQTPHQSREGLQVNDTSASDIGMSFINGAGQQAKTGDDQTEPHSSSNGGIEGVTNVEKEDRESSESKDSEVSSTISSKGSLQDCDSGVSMTVSQPSKPKPAISRDWIDILGNGNLLKKVLREGEGVSTRPIAQAQVRMKVRGSLSSGGVVDRHSSLEFTVGDGDVIQALDIIAPLMEKGETCQIKTDHRYAYGNVGRSPDIPPQSALLYDLELIDVKPPIDFSVITEQQLLVHLNKKRGRGNDLFQRKEFSLAVHSYSRAVNMMARYKEEQSIAEFTPEIADLWVRCLNNLAAAQLKVEMYNEALDSVNKVLESDPENVKALYRCGKVFMFKCDFEQAVTYLQKASNLNPDERAIQAELQRAIRKRDQGRDEEKAMYRRMMTGSRSGANSRQTSPGAGTTHHGDSFSSSWSWRSVLLGAGLVAMAAVTIGYLGFKYRNK